MLLVDMPLLPPTTGGAVDDVQASSHLEESAFWSAMDQLVELSSVDRASSAGRERFALHPLTQCFIRSDIAKEWAER